MERNEEIAIVLWAGTLLMLLLVAGLLFLALAHQNRINRIRAKEADKVLQSFLEGEKKERKRIAADLHDGVSGDLTAVKNFIGAYKRLHSADEDHLIRNIEDGVNEAISNIRRISFNLMPPMLEQGAFRAAVESYLNKMDSDTGTRFSVSGNACNLSPEAGYELYRIIQEFTTNIVKHGSAGNCGINFKRIKNTHVIEIIDDGVKYDFMKLLEEMTGNGLSNINMRLKSINARLVQEDVPVGNHFKIFYHGNH